MRGPGDWGTNIRNSCCGKDAQSCTIGNAYTLGCGEAVNNFIFTSGNIIGAVALGVAGIEVCVKYVHTSVKV